MHPGALGLFHPEGIRSPLGWRRLDSRSSPHIDEVDPENDKGAEDLEKAAAEC